MRVMTVVGARPQFVKCAAVSRVLRKAHEEILVHTGQHHDREMSAAFFDDLDIPAPDYNLGIAGGSHAEMTARMLVGIERLLLSVEPDWLLVYGDTNSTLAAALAAAKLQVRIAHVEAGLRSFNRRMPEEVNRVVTDHLSTLLLCPTANAVVLLAKEGITAGVHDVGDVMYDSVLSNLTRGRAKVSSRRRGSALATVHRPENTDDPVRLSAIFEGLSAIGVDVVVPLHPRTRKVLDATPSVAAKVGPNISIVEPMGYLELLVTAADASVILTDSGGLQKEAYFVGVRCVTMRDETEWTETVDAGANIVVGADATRIADEARDAIAAGRLATDDGSGPFGDGHAAERIVSLLMST